MDEWHHNLAAIDKSGEDSPQRYKSLIITHNRNTTINKIDKSKKKSLPKC